MKQFIAKNKRAITGIAACILIGGTTLAFQDSPVIHLQYPYNEQSQTTCSTDTTPDKKMTMKQLDELTDNLDVELKNVAEELKKINMEDIIKQVEASLKEVNLEKINADVQKSLASVNFQNIEKEIKDALKEVKCDKINADVKQALQEAKTEMNKVNTAEIKKAMEEAGKALDKAKLELKQIDFGKIMDNAKEGIDKAKAKLRSMKTMFTEMEKDGLIDTKAGFTVNFKDGDLFINGKKQPKAVTDKYSKYISDVKDFDDKDFSITIDKEEQ
jgi:copper chaperone CopZ